MDQNFPEPILRALDEFIIDVRLIPLRQIDPRLPELDDRPLLIALQQRGFPGLVTNNYKMLSNPKELAAILKTRLSVFAIDASSGSGHATRSRRTRGNSSSAPPSASTPTPPLSTTRSRSPTTSSRHRSRRGHRRHPLRVAIGAERPDGQPPTAGRAALPHWRAGQRGGTSVARSWSLPDARTHCRTAFVSDQCGYRASSSSPAPSRTAASTCVRSRSPRARFLATSTCSQGRHGVELSSVAADPLVLGFSGGRRAGLRPLVRRRCDRQTSWPGVAGTPRAGSQLRSMKLTQRSANQSSDPHRACQ